MWFIIIGVAVVGYLVFSISIGSRINRINARVISMIRQSRHLEEVLAYLQTEGYSLEKAHRFLNDITFGSRGSELKGSALDDLSAQNWMMAYTMEYFNPDGSLRG